MRQCYGLTRNFHRCGREGDWRWFCPEHRRQPIVWLSFILFTVVAGTASIYSAWFSGESATLREEIGRVREVTETERQTFRSLSAELEATFSGTWEASPYPHKILSPVNHQYYVEILAPAVDTVEPIRLYATEPYTFKTLDVRRAIFRAKQAVPAGSSPLGKTFSALQQYNSLQLNIPFIIPGRFENKPITVEHVKLTFFVNGERRSPFEFDAGHVVPLQFPDDSGRLAWASFLVTLKEPVRSLIAPREE